MEEIRAKQRSRDRNIKEGDNNTTYFHALANQRNRKKRIKVLEGPDGPLTETNEMLDLASDFYKNLFGYEESLDVSLDETFWSEEDKVTQAENLMLQSPFSEEIKKAVFDSYSEGAPSPNGLSFLYLDLSRGVS